MQEVRVLLCADVVPSRCNKLFFESGEIASIFDEKFCKVWEKADARIFNLESPLYDGISKINKCGPHLTSSTMCLHGLSLLNPNLILLANNHIMDHGDAGLDSTLSALCSKGIDYVGVGKTAFEMKKSHIIEYNGIKIAFYNCAENEFSIATRKKSGANPFDFIESFDDVEKLKKENDFVVVCYHGGKEFYPYPSPNLQRIFRKFAAKGADVVVAQHTHCIGCYEMYEGATLVYGQGNFLFDMNMVNSDPCSLILQLNISGKGCHVEFIPVMLNQGKVIQLDDNADCLKKFLSRSEQIKSSAFLETQYASFAKEQFPYYLRMLKGNTFFYKVLYKLFRRMVAGLTKKSNLLAIQNFIECEAHRELLLKGLKDNI